MRTSRRHDKAAPSRRTAIHMKRGSRAWKKHGKQRWKWRKKKLRQRKRARREAR